MTWPARLIGLAAPLVLAWFLRRAIRDLLGIARTQDRRIAWLEDAERQRRIAGRETWP